MLFRSNDTATTEIYTTANTLSLHDALQISRRQGGWKSGPEFVGTPEELAEKLAPYVSLGFGHIYFDYAAPWDAETLERLIGEVKPMILDRVGAASPA